ncbi:hypothetical protein HK097_002709 [Rhizophlyctis rosea]|uniref:AAA+ ATPase domain-containing protein n=1 Tax=Rhizophlyctis rosea TaxID=64517 RepID=A0AAD5SMG9_9FUNG|nr:hypothetical protein HK097_002709 [Rhizophlyctis rosea]
MSPSSSRSGKGNQPSSVSTQPVVQKRKRADDITKNIRDESSTDDQPISFPNNADMLDRAETIPLKLPEDLETFLQSEFPDYLKGKRTQLGRNINRCFLLHGPPGTGKSEICKLVATEMKRIYSEHFAEGLVRLDHMDPRKMHESTDFYFHQLSADILLNPWHGRTERNIADIFANIPRRFGLSVVYVDEVDSILGQSSRNGDEPMLERGTKLFQQIIEGSLAISLPENTFLLATSNIGFEETRKPCFQRFGSRMYIGPPETREELALIIQQAWMKDIHEEDRTLFYHETPVPAIEGQNLLVPDELLDRLLKRNTVPRDIATIMSKMDKLRRRLARQQGSPPLEYSEPNDYFKEVASKFLAEHEHVYEENTDGHIAKWCEPNHEYDHFSVAPHKSLDDIPFRFSYK